MSRILVFLQTFACTLLGLSIPTSVLSAESARLPPEVRHFLATYCGKCHGETDQKGDRRFDRLPDSIPDENTLVDYQDIVDQLNLGEMPPADQVQPPAAVLSETVRALTVRISEYHSQGKGSEQRTVLRRLNAREYRNTIRDLFQFDMQMFDPARGFPSDQLAEQLDNQGESLVTSGYLLARYLDAAEQVVAKAFGSFKQPEVQTWRFTENFVQQPEIDQVHRRTNQLKHLTLYDVVGADKHEGAYAAIEDFKNGVPYDGIYEIRFQAEAMHRLHPYDDSFLNRDRTEPLRLGIVAGNHQAGKLYVPQPLEPLLAELDLADDAQWYSVRVPLDAGWTPRFTFRNGLMDARNLWSKIHRKYPELFPKRTDNGIVEARFNAIKFGQLPHIRIYEVEIRGPFLESWPTAAQRMVLADDFQQVAETQALPEAKIRRHLEAFATKAYRRPASEEEVDRLMGVVTTRQAMGRSSLLAYQDALKAVLCSPHFIYLEDPQDPKHGDFALASRLSYFLWSSMPDQELVDCAQSGKLRNPNVLAEQVERMLQDKKSTAFVADFVESWLTLRSLGTMPPDRGRFNDYYQHDLERAMRTETVKFTQYLLDENLPVQNFLDAEFAFVNKRLAALYGLPIPGSWEFARVKLPSKSRGGLLGQASVLTVTANGIDTSPVNRGVWLLENLLGTPPSPPPPDVPPLDPDIRGAVTIREQLDKHRKVATCFDCHRKIDPLGFALENFDPIGQWREKYPGGTKVDASGEMPDGRSFANLEGLKAVLLEKDELFVRSLMRKLLAYATGRAIVPADRPTLDQMERKLSEQGYGFRDLIKLVVLSEAFRK